MGIGKKEACHSIIGSTTPNRLPINGVTALEKWTSVENLSIQKLSRLERFYQYKDIYILCLFLNFPRFPQPTSQQNPPQSSSSNTSTAKKIIFHNPQTWQRKKADFKCMCKSVLVKLLMFMLPLFIRHVLWLCFQSQKIFRLE